MVPVTLIVLPAPVKLIVCETPSVVMNAKLPFPEAVPIPDWAVEPPVRLMEPPALTVMV